MEIEKNKPPVEKKQSVDANVYPQTNAIDECFQQEVGQSTRRT
jgi:hypothetical protein